MKNISSVYLLLLITLYNYPMGRWESAKHYTINSYNYYATAGSALMYGYKRQPFKTFLGTTDACSQMIKSVLSYNCLKKFTHVANPWVNRIGNVINIVLGWLSFFNVAHYAQSTWRAPQLQEIIESNNMADLRWQLDHGLNPNTAPFLHVAIDNHTDVAMVELFI